jgi:glycosyltransferase involved in cell wall biosynthesis
MRIAMFTNTYLPHVGGVANSVKQFTDGYRQRGHRVLVVAPTYEEEYPEDEEENVVRVPALKNIQESSFSLALPTTPKLTRALDEFQPELLHSHHPYIIGDTALRLAASQELPLVFTYHTMYEHYTHYSPIAPHQLKEFVIELATGYANLCSRVIAPSQSVAEILRDRGVKTPISVIPTGVDVERFAEGDGDAIRTKYGVPADATVPGYVGRLAKEKNLEFLSRALTDYLEKDDSARVLMVGDGGAREEIEGIFANAEMSERLHMTGELTGRAVVDAYHAMDVFAFASLTETQGMALAEALGAGRPVVALEAPGAREIIRDGENGRLVREKDTGRFATALEQVVEEVREAPAKMARRCRDSVEDYRSERCIERALDLYAGLLRDERPLLPPAEAALHTLPEALAREGRLWLNRLRALARASVREHGTDEK